MTHTVEQGASRTRRPILDFTDLHSRTTSPKSTQTHETPSPRIHPPLLTPCDPQRLDARTSLRRESRSV